MTRVLASQVHPSAGVDEPRHKRFLALASGAAGLGWLLLSTRLMQAPAALDERLVTGTVSSDGNALVWGTAAFVPLALALFVSRTGRLRTGHGLAVATLVALTAALAIDGEVIAIATAAASGWAIAKFPRSAPPSQENGASPDLITRHAPDGSTLAADGPCETVLGCLSAELAGSGFLDRVHVQDRVVFRKALDDARDGEARCEARIIDPRTQVTRHIEMRCSGFSGSEVLCRSRDVTAERDRMTALEDNVRAAEELSRAKSRFIAVASHELRTPLNAIIGFSDLLRSLDEEAAPLPHARRQEYAGLIHGAGRHLLDVVNDLLDMSRIEAGRYELCVEEVDLRDTTGRCLSMMAKMAADRGVRLVDVTDRSLPSIQADPRACRQMLINLVSNALKFAPEGSTVSVGASLHGETIALRVSDRGEGMTREDVARLGQPFTQVGSGDDHARLAEGTGLGLSIVKGLVELHDGSLEVRSLRAPAAGHGTEVVLSIPVRHQPRTHHEADQPRVVALPQRASTETAERLSNRSIEYGRVSA